MGKKKIVFIETKELGKEKTLAENTEKYYSMGEKVIILTSSAERGEFFDNYLWTFKQLSFIPHVFVNEVAQKINDEPVIITLFEDNIINAGVLILDRPASEDFIKQFQVIIDFVDRTNEQTLKDSRKRYKEYNRDLFEIIYS